MLMFAHQHKSQSIVEADRNVFCTHFVITEVMNKLKLGGQSDLSILNFMTLSQIKLKDGHQSQQASTPKKYKGHFMEICPIVEIFQRESE